jgi:nitrogen fixation NifU-like protein
MIVEALYKQALLDHYRHPRNRCNGPIQGADAVERGANPRCGDEVEIGIFLQATTIEAIKFRGRGCSICIASASMMTEAVTGLTVASTRMLCEQMRSWFGQLGPEPELDLPESLQALLAVRQHPARQKCVLLSWEALADAIASATDR